MRKVFISIILLGTLSAGYSQSGLGAGLYIGSDVDLAITYFGLNEGLSGFAGVGFGLIETVYGRDYSATMSSNEFNDPEMSKSQSAGFIIEGGITNPLGSSLKTHFYSGLALRFAKQYQQLYDPLHILASDGMYHYETGKKVSIGGSVGIIFKATDKFRIDLGVGYLRSMRFKLGLILSI